MLNIITTVFTDQLINALCNTLVYSLLQGVLLAAAAGLIVIFTRKASAATRYNLLVGALVLFAIGTLITLTIQLNYTVPITATRVIHQQVGNVDVVQVVNDGAFKPAGQNLMAVANYYLNTYHTTIVLIWFLIICAKSIQLTTGLQGVYRLKRKNVYKVGVDWEVKMRFMAHKLGIRQKIALLESSLAKVPMVIGHLKPVILIPVGLLTALTTAEVEAILMHELAHIRRRDYLVNLLQSMVEIVFFFNPAVLWVSQLIKTEREHCCDDMALANNTSKAGYISALVSCEEYQAGPAYAMAFPGKKKYLVDRVKRLVTNRNHSLDVFEKTLLAICLVMSGLCLSAYAEKDNIKKVAHAIVAVMKPKVLNKAQTHHLTVQEKTIAKQEKELQKHTEIAEPNSPVEPAEDTTKKTSRQNQQVRIDHRTDSVKNIQVSTTTLGKLNGTLGNLNFNQQKINLRLDSVNTQVRVNYNQSKLQRQAYLDSAKQYRKMAKGYTKQPIAAIPPYDTKRSDYKPYKSIQDKSQRDAAINEMLKDGLIKTRDNLSFKISNKEFIINDQKQPEDVFQKYKAKYVKNTTGDWSWMYNYDTDKKRETNTVIDNPKN